MKNKENTFVPLENFGLGLSTNSVLSFIKMYGDTYASNKHISQRLGVSEQTVTRSIKKLQELQYIQVYNPLGRSRYLKLINQPPVMTFEKEIKMTTLPSQNVEDPLQNVEDPNQNVEVNLVKMSNNNKENNKLYKKLHIKENNKPEEVVEEELDTITFSSKTDKYKGEVITPERWEEMNQEEVLREIEESTNRLLERGLK